MPASDPYRSPRHFYTALPKVDLHRHLEGSLRLRTLREVDRSLGLGLPNTGRLRELVQIGDREPLNFQNFLSKFDTLRLFYRSPEIISRITREAVQDAAQDSVRYLELRFTPAALCRAQDFPLGDVMDWVIEGARQGEQETGVLVRLIASVNRHESPELAEQVVCQAAGRRSAGIIGIDLAGNEAGYSALHFAGAFREARQAGLRITVHAGEWGGAGNVAEAITLLGAERIGHGVRVLEDPAVTRLARERGVVFEVCITSNYQSGVVPGLQMHPLPRMLSLGLCATINTDDPSISRITLGDEYRLAVEELGLSQQVLRERILAAAQAAFLDDEERQRLEASLAQDFSTIS